MARGTGVQLSLGFQMDTTQAERALGNLTNKLDGMGQKTNKVNESSRKAGTTITKMSKDIDKLKISSARTASSMNTLTNTLKRLGTVGGVGLGLTTIAYGLRRLIGSGIELAADFEQEMNKVRAISGAVGKDFQMLEKEARRLGATTRFTALQVASGMSYLAQAGFTTEQILQSIEGVLKTAAAGFLDLGEAADMLLAF